MNRESVAALGNDELVETTRELARRSCAVEAELLVHLGEIDQRRLYLDRAFSSMFAFCTRELGFSEGAAYNRISVARAARKLPALIDAVRSGSVHLAGLRLLAPHLTDENHAQILQRAAGRSKEEIGELVAALAPRPPLPPVLRKLPDQCGFRLAPTSQAEAEVDPGVPWSAAPAAQRDMVVDPPRVPAAAPERARRPPAGPPLSPIAADIYRLHLTIPRELRDEIREAQDLLRHRVPDGDLAKIFQMALKALVTQVKKERFAVGRKARSAAPESGLSESRRGLSESRRGPSESQHGPGEPQHGPGEARHGPGEARHGPSESQHGPGESRHVPDAMKRAVYERDGGRCAFTDAQGRRCEETAALEIDHVEGFARTHRHELDALRLLCRAHNQHAADKMYGRAFMEVARHVHGAQPEPCYTDNPCTFAPSSGPPPRA